MSRLTRCADLVTLLAHRAGVAGDVPVYTVLSEGRTAAPSIDCATLFRRARAIAARLQRGRNVAGERVVLPCPSTLDAMAAFWGIVCAGAIPVPVPAVRGKHLRRLSGIIQSCRPLMMILLDGERPPADGASWLGDVELVTLSDVADEEAAEWSAPTATGESVAFLQYTSGSTGAPKGVIVSHANLMANAERQEQVFGLHADSTCLTWLPLYHDMGLIGGMLQPVYTGYPTLFMPPAAFVERPMRWLQALSAHRATVSGAPNFGYELATRVLEAAPQAGLDLSSWEVAFCGAEPVREDTLRRFVKACAPYGFDGSALRPCYGLAEATLLVSAGRWQDSNAREQAPGEVTPSAAQRRVPVGAAASGLSIAIVDPATGVRMPDGESGEVWIAGDGVAQGYWHEPAATQEVFGARLSDGGSETYLRTGDVGMIHRDELWILDRLKDILIIRGVNHYAHDIEAAVEASHPLIRTHSVAAFGIVVDNEEDLVVVVEMERRFRAEDAEDVRARVQQCLAQHAQLSAHDVVLARQGAIPRTSSGKIRRRACRDAYLARELRTIDDAVETEASPSNAPAEPADRLRAIVGSALRVRPQDVPLDRQIGGLGIDSLRVFQAKLAIEAVLGTEVAYSTLLDMTVADVLAAASTAASSGAALSSAAPLNAVTTEPSQTSPSGSERETAECPLSIGQQALLYMNDLRPDDNAYTIARAFRISGALDVAALTAAFEQLAARHEALRATVHGEPGSPTLQFNGHVSCEERDATAWDECELQAELTRSTRAPFDLNAGPVVTAHLFRRSDAQFVLLVRAHHLAVDLWSLALLLDELEHAYRARRSGAEAALPPAGRYSDFVAWQHGFVRSDAGKRLSDYWHERLNGHLDALALPMAQAQPSSEPGARRHAFDLDARTTDALRRICQGQGATLNTLIIAACQVLLARYSGQRRFLVGTLASGRTRPEFATAVGYYVNLLPLRVDARRNTPFTTFLRRTRTELNTALDHQDLPFSAMVERLRPERTGDRSPLVRAVCVCQPASVRSERDLGAVALNRSGDLMPFDDLMLQPLEIEDPGAQFDLSFIFTDGAAGLTGVLQYDGALFLPEDVAAMAGSLGTLLGAIAECPDTRIGELPLVSADEYRAKAAQWNDTERPLDLLTCVHDVIARQAASTPEAIALIHRARSWTYADLMRHVDACAVRLNRMGAGPETRVAVCLDRSMDLVVALLGVLRAGAAYVPLDPSHPSDRRERILRASSPSALVTSRWLASQMPPDDVPVVDIEDLCEPIDDAAPADRPCAHPENAAYIMYTSGSTGVPKGVVVSHRQLVNLFAGMNEAVGCGPDDTLVAVTSVAFDISVVELLWTLAHGARVVIADDVAAASKRKRGHARELDFSLFYFADSDHGSASGKYELLLEGAAFADRNGFAAVWTPERHFHAFGGLYPNPSLTSAALATITRRVRLRAGSVVLPLHHPIRVAEEWAVVDNLSAGRVGVAFASGWHAEDFAFQPEAYANRKEIMLERIDMVRALWRGEALEVTSGDGQRRSVRLYPKPIQSELPIWLTAAGSPDTFAHAARISANVLTHLLGQSPEALHDRIGVYRTALEQRELDPHTFDVTLMLHAYVDETRDKVIAHALAPFKAYLRSSLDLVSRLVKALNLDLDLERMTPRDLDDLIEFAAQRYMGTSGLFGTPRECLDILDRLVESGVSEVACLIDFGVERHAAMASLTRIAKLRDRFNATCDPVSYSIPAQAVRTGATMLQCTPSMLAMMLDDRSMRERLGAMRAVLLGGEPLPIGLLGDLGFPRNCLNMYGPTETTVWSAVKPTPHALERVTVGGPIANTQLYVLDEGAGALPEGVVGEVWIGGAGVARGYWNDPSMTAERFIPDPWSAVPGARLYRTGDVGRQLRDGSIELLGRADQQVKLRGYRVELGDVEAALNAVPGIRTAIVIKHDDAVRGGELVAYVTPEDLEQFDADAIKAALQSTLPPYMVPGAICAVERLPVNANGKVDRKRLAQLPVSQPARRRDVVEPRTESEARIRRIWQQVLGADVLSVHDNFFDVGGHSLLIAQVHERLQREIGWTFPLVVLLERPTIAGIAEFMEHGRPKVTSDAQVRAADQRRAWRAHRAMAVQANTTRVPV